MHYVAHVGITLQYDIAACKKDTWHYIKTIGTIEYRWRLTNNLLYEVMAGIFEDKNEALKHAKQIYVTLLYSMLQNHIKMSDAGCGSYGQLLFVAEEDGDYVEFCDKESFFFWSPSNTGGQLGPGVYEVKQSMDDYDSYKFLSASLSVSFPDACLDFDNIDDYTFTFCREAQPLLATVVAADSICDYGMKMTMLCGLLEHLSIDGIKEESVIAELDELINHVKNSDLVEDQRTQLINYLNGGKQVSSRQKCRLLIDKYAHKRYGSFTARKVFDAAYGIRSTFSHGEEICINRADPSSYMMHLVLDVIMEYFLGKEASS